MEAQRVRTALNTAVWPPVAPVGSWCASSYAPHEGVPVSTGFFFPDLGVHVV
jgi:hypothetical protein